MSRSRRNHFEFPDYRAWQRIEDLWGMRKERQRVRMRLDQETRVLGRCFHAESLAVRADRFEELGCDAEAQQLRSELDRIENREGDGDLSRLGPRFICL